LSQTIPTVTGVFASPVGGSFPTGFLFNFFSGFMIAGYGGINILKETESVVNIVFGHGKGVCRELLTHRLNMEVDL
jgi:hypothetical protein